MFREQLVDKAFLRDTRKTFYFARLSYLIHTFCTHTIYTPITYICWCGHSKRKTLDRFSTTYTPIFQRESYSSLMRNPCSLFSFPLPMSYLERRFVPKHNPHIFRVQRVFWNLGSFEELPKEASEAWLMLWAIVEFGKLEKTKV